MAPAASSVTAAVAAAKAAVADRLKQTQGNMVMEATAIDADVNAMRLGDSAVSEKFAVPWDPEFQVGCISADSCKACREPIYVLPLDSSDLPSLRASADRSEPSYVTPSSSFATVGAIMPPPGLESMPPWRSDRIASRFGFRGNVATRSPTGDSPVRPQTRKRRRCQLLLATHLKELEGEYTSCIIHVRQIHRLGFRSPELLHEYCSRFGPVKRVAVSNAHEKLENAPPSPFPVRVRPSGIGFIVMERPEDAAEVVAQGEIQTIKGYQIRVRKFEVRKQDKPKEFVDAFGVVGGHADETLSETSSEAGRNRGHLDSEVSSMPTNTPSSSANSTADDLGSETGSIAPSREGDHHDP